MDRDEIVFEQYYEDVYRFLRALTRDRDLAELMEQVGKSLPEAALRQRDAPERGTMTMK